MNRTLKLILQSCLDRTMEELRIEWTVVDDNGMVVASGHGEYIPAALAKIWIEHLEKQPTVGNRTYYVAK